METSLTTGIMDVNIGLMQANALFFVGNVILLWMVFRGVTNANLYGANTFSKAMHSIMSLCIVGFNLNTYGNITSMVNNWAFALSETGEELPGGGERESPAPDAQSRQPYLFPILKKI